MANTKKGMTPVII